MKDRIEPNEEGTGYHLAKPKPAGTWTRDDLMAFGANTCDKALILAAKKNADYTGDADPFGNLRRGGPYGIAIRLDDKVSRALTLLKPGAGAAEIKEETIVDTCLDGLNYFWLALALLEVQKKK